MVSSGVIGISAQIVESTDIGGKQNVTPDMTLQQRITTSFQNMRKDWKKLVGNKATGLFYMLLASSKIVQGVIGQTFRLFIGLLELMMPIFIPTLVWIIQNLARLVGIVQTVIDGITEKFKEVFEIAWAAVKTVVSAGWTGVEDLFGLGDKVDVQSEVDRFYKDRIIGTPLSQDELDSWARLSNGGLIQGGPIKPEHWNEKPKGTYHKAYDIDEGVEEVAVATPQLSWLYANGERMPPGGQINSDLTDELIEGGDINVIDEKYDEEDGESFHDQFFSWTDNIEPFGWGDIVGWVEGSVSENITWEKIFLLFFGTYSKQTVSSEDILKEVIDKGTSGEDVTKDATGTISDLDDGYPRASDVHENPFYWNQYWTPPTEEEAGFWSSK